MKNLIIFILSLFALDGMSQISIISQDLVKSDEKYKVIYKGVYFDVDTTIVK
jgi:hypothetical protein